MVFSEASIVRIADKHALMIKVFRVLKPGGRFIASNWLIGHDHAPSPDRVACIAAEALDFGMASPWRYQDAMRGAGFVEQNILIWSRMIPVLESGEHCPTHLRARKPRRAAHGGRWSPDSSFARLNAGKTRRVCNERQ